MKKIGVLVGSLRKESYTKKMALNMMDLFDDNYHPELINIGDLPLYNQDFDDYNTLPEEARNFRNKTKEMDAFLFVTPEYNRSVPGVLKNALDVGSRPKTESVWNDKPAAVASVSPGVLSAFGAHHHLRQSLVFFNMPVVQQPEVYLGRAANLLDENGKLNSEGTKQFLKSFISTFQNLIQLHD